MCASNILINEPNNFLMLPIKFHGKTLPLGFLSKAFARAGLAS